MKQIDGRFFWAACVLALLFGSLAIWALAKETLEKDQRKGLHPLPAVGSGFLAGSFKLADPSPPPVPTSPEPTVSAVPAPPPSASAHPGGPPGRQSCGSLPQVRAAVATWVAGLSFQGAPATVLVEVAESGQARVVAPLPDQAASRAILLPEPCRTEQFQVSVTKLNR